MHKVKSEFDVLRGEKNILGDQLRKFRCASNVSQDAFAAACQLLGWDLARGTLAKIESGIRRVTDAEVVLLAHVLKVEPGELLSGILITDAISTARHGHESRP
jgi:transcriptional regulator with XRE-family HTH domain